MEGGHIKLTYVDLEDLVHVRPVFYRKRADLSAFDFRLNGTKIEVFVYFCMPWGENGGQQSIVGFPDLTELLQGKCEGLMKFWDAENLDYANCWDDDDDDDDHDIWHVSTSDNMEWNDSHRGLRCWVLTKDVAGNYGTGWWAEGSDPKTAGMWWDVFFRTLIKIWNHGFNECLWVKGQKL